MTDEAEAFYQTALEQRDLSDVRPLYRALLKRLQEEDPEAYGEAVRRYEEEVEPAVAGADDPVTEWLRYGAWLAGRLAPGRVAAVDGSGRAEEVELGAGGDEPTPPATDPGDGEARGPEGARVPAGALLLHLPESSREPAFPLALPAEPTEHQEATRELLCG